MRQQAPASTPTVHAVAEGPAPGRIVAAAVIAELRVRAARAPLESLIPTYGNSRAAMRM